VSGSYKPGEGKKEGALEVVVMMAAVFGMLFLLIWYAASNKIVFHLTIPFTWLAKTWLLLPGGEKTYVEILHAALKFRSDSGAVGLMDWMSYVTRCIRPAVFLGSAMLFVWVLSQMFRTKAKIQRNFSKRPDLFLEGMSHVFTGIAPILHLRMALAKNKAEKWMRQAWPEDLLLKNEINGTKVPRIIVDKQVDPKRAEAFFIGGPRSMKDAKYAARKISTTMLGNLVVDLVNDHRKQVVYPDRFSSVGKIMYGLLCAYAFGDKRDYEKARDQLNNSCRGAASGIPNLEVATWIFEKYRNEKTARKLFAIHHWEYTYLYALFIEAKRRGKITHPQFLWLKPTERILFYVLNTVGRKTPHLESAGAFCQYNYERECARLGRLPIVRNEKGEYVPGHAMQPAVQGLEHEWAHLSTSIDEEDDWWKKDSIWRAQNYGIAKLLQPVPTPQGDPLPETEFDTQMSEQRRAAQAREASAGESLAQSQWEGGAI
jgi:hypothetical protein